MEHGLFFGTALNFWARVIPSPPIRRLRQRTQLVAYLGGAALFENVFDTLFVAAPLFAHQRQLSDRTGRRKIFVLTAAIVYGLALFVVATGCAGRRRAPNDRVDL